MINTTIRPIALTDIDQCAKMAIDSFGLGEYSEDEFSTMRDEFKMAFNGNGWEVPKYFVAENNSEIVGMAGYIQSWMDWDTYEFFWLSVKKGYEGNGIATALVKHRENDIINSVTHKTDITITFSCTNKLISYHEKNGYNVILRKAAKKEVLMGKTFMKK